MKTVPLGGGASEEAWQDCAAGTQSDEAPRADVSRARCLGSPIVVGCTMIDMHVRTEMDERFKVSSSCHRGC